MSLAARQVVAQSVDNGPSDFATYRLLCTLQGDAETVHAIFGSEAAGPMVFPPAWPARPPAQPIACATPATPACAPRTHQASGGVPARGP